jgi:hypothetical protein
VIRRLVDQLKGLLRPGEGAEGIGVLLIFWSIGLGGYFFWVGPSIFLIIASAPLVMFGLIVFDHFFPRRRLTYLADVYADMILRRSVFCSLVCAWCAIIAICLEENFSAALSLGFAVFFLIYGYLTRYRAQRGFFADNQYEVLELITFFTSDQSGNIPPGTRANRHPIVASKSAALANAKLDGRTV